MCKIFHTTDNFSKMIERSSALLDGYIERLYEANSAREWFSATHWYTDACYSLLQEQQA